MTDSTRRVIEVNKGIIGPTAPRPNAVRRRRLADYPGVSAAHRDLARRLASPVLIGPPICDELMALVEHAFLEDEAACARHLGAFRGRRAADVARAEGRPVEAVAATLEHLAVGRRLIGDSGPPEDRKYRLMPLMPGMFEMVLISESPETMSPWHWRFAELFEALFETGYVAEYQSRGQPFVRFVPVAGALGAHPAALPADRLDVVLDRFDAFGVGFCQCRTSSRVAGHGCDRPLEVCVAMGRWAREGVESGFLRSVSKQGVLDIKREAEAHGMVTWIINVESTKSQASCSCCGCCCKAMRTVNEFGVPGMMAPPHFMPRFDRAACVHCGRCAKSCPMGAITVDTQAKTLVHQPGRCIGCGLCLLACGTAKAISLEPVPQFRLPYRSWLSLLLHNAPATLATTWRVWRGR